MVGPHGCLLDVLVPVENLPTWCGQKTPQRKQRSCCSGTVLKDNIMEEDLPDFDVPDAEFLVTVGDAGATVLCARHTQAFVRMHEAALIAHTVYELPGDDEPIVCQACHLDEVTRPRLILPH